MRWPVSAHLACGRRPQQRRGAAPHTSSEAVVQQRLPGPCDRRAPHPRERAPRMRPVDPPRAHRPARRAPEASMRLIICSAGGRGAGRRGATDRSLAQLSRKDTPGALRRRRCNDEAGPPGRLASCGKGMPASRWIAAITKLPRAEQWLRHAGVPGHVCSSSVSTPSLSLGCRNTTCQAGAHAQHGGHAGGQGRGGQTLPLSRRHPGAQPRHRPEGSHPSPCCGATSGQWPLLAV